jgi:hypothetical protein
MKETQCPLCYGDLEVHQVAPCDDCGCHPDELEHFRKGQHRYAKYEVFPGLSLVLCDFCDVDFGSYDPTFFGLPRGTPLGYGRMQLLQLLEQPKLSQDKYCSQCERRLSFLRFVQRARAQSAVIPKKVD